MPPVEHLISRPRFPRHHQEPLRTGKLYRFETIPGVVAESGIPEDAPVFVGANRFVLRTLLFLRLT
jgi:hypothetical protein